MKAICKECNRFLFDYSEEDSLIFKTQSLGFIYKLPILYGSSERLFFCCEDHQKAYYKKTFSKEDIEKANQIVSEIKEGIPQAAQEISEKMSKLSKFLKNE